MSEQLRVGRRTVRITHPERVVFPSAGLTKLDLARHYERVAPLMLPYVRDRPLALPAFPDGIEGDGFFMKAVPRYFPEWVERVTVPKKGGTATHPPWPRTPRQSFTSRVKTWSRSTPGSRAPMRYASPTG